MKIPSNRSEQMQTARPRGTRYPQLSSVNAVTGCALIASTAVIQPIRHTGWGILRLSRPRWHRCNILRVSCNGKDGKIFDQINYAFKSDVRI